MRMQKIEAILFLISIIVFSGCAARNNQFQTQPVTPDANSVKPQTIRVSSSEADSSEPAVASGKDGNIFVVWVEHKTDKTADVLLRQYDSNGQPKGVEVRVNPQSGQATAWRGDPPTIIVGEDKAIYVGWTAKIESAEGQATTLYLSVSRDGGGTFDSPVKVNDDSIPAGHGMHSLAIDSAGHVFMAWLDERYLKTRAPAKTPAAAPASTPKDEMKMEGMSHHKEPNAEIYFAVSDNGGKSFSANKRLAGDVCPCCKTSILSASNDQIYVSWRQVLTNDFRHIAVASSNDGGKNFSSPVIVSDDQWQIDACPVSGAALAENSDNSLTVTWFTSGKAGKPGLYSSESKDGGKSFLPRAFVSESAVSGTPVMRSNNSLKNSVFWENNGKMMTAVLDNNLTVADQQEIGDGELVSADVTKDRIFIGYVKKENEKHAVWLSLFDKPSA